MKTEGLTATEAECAAGRTAPRVSLSDIEANIAYQVSFTAADAIKHLNGGDAGAIVGTILQDVPGSLDVLMVHMMVLRNGFTIIGKAAPADARNFDPDLGRKLAYEDAVRQVWPLMGYELRERLHRGANIHGIGPNEARGKNPLYRGPDMDFGQAIDALKEGRRVARTGWNGEGMFAYLVPPASYPVQTGAAKAHFGEGSLVPYNAYLALKGADGAVSTWAPSTSDALADDWFVVE